MKQALRPASTIIERLGGEAVVAKRTKTANSQPYKWQYERAKGGTGGLIPQRHHPTLLDLAKELGVALTPADFLPVNEPNTASSDNTAGRAGGSFLHPISETEKSRSLGGAASRSASLGGDQSSSELQSLSAPVGAGEST